MATREINSDERRIYNMPTNYVYFYHTKELYMLPTYPSEAILDSQNVNFASETPLARSSPIYSYVNSGPRSITFTFELHRELMKKVNSTNMITALKDDYVDDLVKAIQGIVLPNYDSSQKLIDPPVVAVRIDNQIFIKGVVTDGLNVTYDRPILADGKYAVIKISFSVKEIDPWDAQLVANNGSYRPPFNGNDPVMNIDLARNTVGSKSDGGSTSRARMG